METPVFEEVDPASDCDCPGCVLWRRVLPHAADGRAGGHPAAHRTLLLAAASAAVLAAGNAVPAAAVPSVAERPGVPVGDEPATPQGGTAPLHGPGGAPAGPPALAGTSRAEIIKRAKTWVAAKVPYNMSKYWSDGYRQDCSGFVSMAWGLAGNEWTGSLGKYGTRIAKDDLQPGDILLFHNPVNPQNGSHVVLFGGWTDYTHTYYTAYEQTRPSTRKQTTPYAYWSHSSQYLAYRYTGLAAGAPGAPPKSAGATPFPGAKYFGPGANNKYVTQLGTMLVARGAQRFYTRGPGPRWTDADRRATQAFQQAQGWRGADADGLPGPRTWQLLTDGTGRSIAGGAAGAAGPGGKPAKPAVPAKPAKPAKPAVPARPAVHTRAAAPAYPGRASFRPGAVNSHVTQLGRQLVKRGFGKHYTSGPGPRWGETDRRNVEAFQRAQGWRGGAADGFPGPETWRRLFS